jgi:hypothetical protein
MSTVQTLYPNYPLRRAEQGPSPLLGMAIAAAILALAVLANAGQAREGWGWSASPAGDCAVNADRDGTCAPVPEPGVRINSPLAPYGQCAAMPFRAANAPGER